ncbi:hypothetical protein MKW92_038314 [Papaver armeniacum]|nr:hypothetical protein MKW92_038314 [Papaver armeniacum]
MAGAVNKPKNGKAITRAQYYSKNSHIKVIDDKTETHHTFDVSFYTDIIRTTVTPETSIVDEWIKRVYESFHSKLEDGNNLIVGLDIEWVRLCERNKVSVLQLCLAHQCLIFQFLGLPKHEVPESLIDFLNDGRIIFVGSGIDQDANKLWIDYGLNVARREDLAGLSDHKLGTKDLYQSGLQFLMWKVLGKNLHKPKGLTLSRWDFDFLTNEQVAYACLDAYASFKLGMKLMHRPRTVNKQGFNRQSYVHMMGDSSSFSTSKKDGLPEDVLVDIFQRLPIKSICKFMCLSKVWLSNLSEYMHTKFKTLENEPWAIFSKNRKSTHFISSCRSYLVMMGFPLVSFLNHTVSMHKIISFIF